MSKKYVYSFAEGDGQNKKLLGGKGANLAEMTNAGIPVPPGFTITTECCAEYFRLGRRWPEGLESEIKSHLTRLETEEGRQFGHGARPLLLSVRSGAARSMPGMMDTVLNVGMNDEIAEAMVLRTGDGRFVYDLYRRLVHTRFAQLG